MSAVANPHQRAANDLRVGRLEKQPIRASFNHLPQDRSGCATRDNGNTGIRRPTAGLDQHLDSAAAGHGKIKNSTIRTQAPNDRNCINGIRGLANHGKISGVLKSIFHAFKREGMIISNDDRSNHFSPEAVLRKAAAFLVVYALLLTASIASAQSGEILRLTGPVDGTTAPRYATATLDPTWAATPTEMFQQPERFAPLDGDVVDFGYTSAKIWVRFEVANDTNDTNQWRIFFHENFKQVFEVYTFFENGSYDTVMALDEKSPFSDRTIAYPQMTAPLALAPGERKTILVSYWSEGTSYLQFSVQSAESFAIMAQSKTARNFIFYGMMMLLIVAALVSLALFGNTLFLVYSLYATSALLYIMHLDGVTFQFLWPNAPALNSKASIFAGAGIFIFGAIYARMFLKTAEYHPFYDRILLSIIAATIGLIVFLYYPNPQFLKQSLVFMSMISIIAFAVAGVVAARKRFREVRFYLLAWVGAVISVTMLNMNHIFGFELPQDMVYDSIRGVMVFDAAMMGLAIADRYHQLRRSRQDALETSLDEAQRNLDLSERLSGLEERFQAAVSLVKTKDEHLQSTVHDLRQPLHALRLNVTNLIHNRPGASTDSEQLMRTFTYLENLVGSHLETAANSPSKDPRMSANEVMESVADMFRPDAEAKGLELILDSVPLRAKPAPMPLMRIITNLVSNAIKYTPAGVVVLRSMRDGRKEWIEVSDTGQGLTAEEFKKALEPNVRLEATEMLAEGSGLGLAIAARMAEEAGLGLRFEPSQIGTKIVVDL